MQDCQSCIFTQFCFFLYPPRGDFWLIYMITQSLPMGNWAKNEGIPPSNQHRKRDKTVKYYQNYGNFATFGKRLYICPGFSFTSRMRTSRETVTIS